ncbi:MAG: DUF3971 domain-containing protein [Alphaproteobacteria bacterium]|nr:DUF3971 domain-containing protein [Alphaproteobacteria bacterium]
MWIELPLALLVVALLLFNSLLIWVATGPRSLSALTPFIEDAFRTADNNYSVEIGETVLLWDGWRHPIDIRLHDVSVVTKEGAVFSKFPEIALGVHVPSLLLGQVLPTSLTISKPIISLFQNDDRSVNFGFAHEVKEVTPDSNVALPFALLLNPLTATDGPLRKLRLVTMHGASVSLGNTKQGVLLNADNTDIEMQKNKQGIVTVSASTVIHYDEFSTPVKAAFNLSKSAPTIDGTVDFEEIQPKIVAALLPITLPGTITMPISGQFVLSLDMNGALTKLGFAIDTGEGVIHSDKLASDIQVTKLHAEGELSNNAQDLHIKNLIADLDGMPLEASGTITGLNENTAVDATASIKKVPTDKVSTFWPLGVSPMSREWVTTSITGGMIEEASINLKVAAGDFAKPELPKEDVDANVTLTGAKIKYVPDHPPLENVDAKIHVDALTLTATLSKASFLKDTKISDGKVIIDNLNLDNPYIKTSADAGLPASEAVHILGLPRINQANRLGMVEARTTGNAKGHVDLGFHFFAPKGKNLADDIAYKISAKLEDVSQPALLGKYEVRDITGDLNVDEKGVEFAGKGNVNGATLLDASVKYLSTPERGIDTFIEATGGMQSANTPRFGVATPPWMNGLFGFKITLKQGGDFAHYELSLNLTETAVNLSQVSWVKPEKIPARLYLSVDKRGEVVTVNSFEISGQDAKAKGTIELSGDSIRKINATGVQLGKSNLDTVNYEVIPGGYKLEARGQSADMSGYMQNGKGDFSFEHFPALDLNADVGQVLLGDGRDLDTVKGEIKCDEKICSSANLTGKTVGGKPFQIRIMRNPKGKRQFTLHAEDAGAFLKALDVVDSVQGGDLSISGNYDDSGAKSLLKGKIDIKDYTVKDAPVLAKIISLASFTGFLDTLQGKGIVFKRLLAPFTLHNDVITLTKAKTSGSAIGMTADGTITLPKTTMDISGTVVPSYSLNSAVAKVPLVGSLLSGGDGQGMFAARYTIKGGEKSPDVSVNPLSILTPGFLRGLFDAFDEPDAKDEEKKEE